MYTVEDLMRERRRLTLDDFVELNPDPVLVFRLHELGEASEEATTAGEPTAPTSGARSTGALSREARVLLIRKRLGGPLASRVGVGRTKGNDIELPMKEISKYHAYFEREEAENRWMLTDVGSKNATFVDGLALEPRARVDLPETCIVGFGPHTFRFYMPPSLYRMLGDSVFGSKRGARVSKPPGF